MGKSEFVGEYIGKSFKTRLDAKGDVIEESNTFIYIKIEKVGLGAYKLITVYGDIGTKIIFGFKDKKNTIVTETTSASGIINIYFEGNKLIHKVSNNFADTKIVDVAELKRIS